MTYEAEMKAMLTETYSVSLQTVRENRATLYVVRVNAFVGAKTSELG